MVIDKWRFSLTDVSNKIVEGADPENNLRNSFLPDEGCYWVSMDYSGEELRVIANVSNEPNWVNTFLSGGDLHKCYSSDTEFLTDSGFKKFHDIVDDKIAQYSDGVIEYVTPTARYENSTDDMVSIKNQYTDLLVTPNHRMLVRTSSRNP